MPPLRRRRWCRATDTKNEQTKKCRNEKCLLSICCCRLSSASETRKNSIAIDRKTEKYRMIRKPVKSAWRSSRMKRKNSEVNKHIKMPWHHQKGWVYNSTKNSEQWNKLFGCLFLWNRKAQTHQHTHTPEWSSFTCTSWIHITCVFNYEKVSILCKNTETGEWVELRVRSNSPTIGRKEGCWLDIRFACCWLAKKGGKGRQLIRLFWGKFVRKADLPWTRLLPSCLSLKIHVVS